MNQECRESKGESKERRHRRVERRERKKGFKGVDCVVEEDQQVLGNMKHNGYEEGR